MRIKKIVIQNYRSFDSSGILIEIPDIKAPFSIVGHNNSGKSNFINALAMCLGGKSFSRSAFSENDFYLKNVTNKILIEVEVDYPIKSSDAFNTVKDMPVFQLKITEEEGVFESSHYFCDENRKQIFNPRSLKRSKTKQYSAEEKEILNEAQKQGAEQVWKWKSKIPVYFIDTAHIEYQLKINSYTLLGKVMDKMIANFESSDNTVKQKDGVLSEQIGKPRKEIFDNTMKYLEDFVLSTDDLEKLVTSIQTVIKKQLEIENENFLLKFGFPSADIFFENLNFYLTDNPAKPKLPIDQMGKGFLSLFVAALFRAILDADKGGSIFIIEEPETFLHEHFQEYFYRVLCDLAKNNQVIYTTHSKKFVNIFQPETIIRLKNIDCLKSEIVYKSEPKIEFPEELDGFLIKNPDDFPKYMRTLEPNLGNIIFASKVIIVEGPHDLLAYKNILSEKINFGLSNIAIVAAWGKDPIVTIVQLCRRFEIPCFVIHDWDLDNKSLSLSVPSEKNDVYKELDVNGKSQYTKNFKILKEVGDAKGLHHNKKNLEEVLGIKLADKGIISVFEKLKDLKLDQAKKSFPNLISDNLLLFLGINKSLKLTEEESQ